MRTANYERNDQQIATTLLQGAANEISRTLRDLRRSVSVFSGEQSGLLARVANAPEDDVLRMQLEDKIRRYFPDYLAFSIADDKGEVYLDDFENIIEEVCLHDIRRFVAQEYEQSVYVHPNPLAYHIDIMVPWLQANGDQGVFFLSFPPDIVAGILANRQIAGHDFLLLNSERTGLVEISAQGSRDKMQREFLLNERELASISHSEAIHGALWQLADIPGEDIYHGIRRSSWLQALVLFVGFLLTSLFTLWLIRQQEKRRLSAEEDVLQSHASLNSVIHGMQDALALKDLAGRYIMMNVACERMLGVSGDALAGKSDEDFMQQDAAAMARNAEEQVIETREAVSVEQQQLVDGAMHTFHVTRMPHRAAAGEVVGVIAVWHDITDRKMMESALSALAESAYQFSGDDFYNIAVNNLARSFNAPYAFVGVFADHTRKSIRTLAVSGNGEIVDNFEYHLEGTPCQNVFRDKRVLIADKAHERFPQDKVLEELGVKSYFGAPLVSSAGEIVGLVVVMDTKPMATRPWSDFILGIFGKRIALELEHGEAETALRASERRYRVLIDTMNEGLGIQDQHGILRYVNDRFCEITGYARQQIIGHPVKERARNLQNCLCPDLLKRKLKGEEVNSYETNFLRPDGVNIHLEISPQLLIGEDGRPRGSFAVISDVTESKQAQEALRKSEQQLRLVTDALPALISYVDKEQRYRFNNKAYEQWFGYPQFNIIGRHVREVLGDEAYDSIRDQIESALAGETVSYEKQINFSGSGIRYVHADYIPDIGAEAEVRGYYEIVADITEHRSAEEQVRLHQAELAHVARLSTMGEMATGLAHEINQPLAAIASYSDACLRMINSGNVNNDKLLNALKQTSAQSKRAGDIIRRIRDFVRKQESQKTLVNVNDIVQDTVEFAAADMRKSHVSLQLYFQQDLLPVLADSIQIEQVLLNLIRNGVESIHMYGAESGEIKISTHLNSDGLVQVTVEDTGVGLDAEHDGKIFDPFYTTKSEGMGMGLSISRSIIDAHSGCLWALQTSVGGAAFHFTLPLASNN